MSSLRSTRTCSSSRNERSASKSRVPRARRHGDRHGSVDRRDSRYGQRAGLRSEPVLEVRRPERGATAPSWMRTSRVRRSSSSPRPPRSSRARSRLQSRFPARDTLEVGGRTIHNAEDGFMAGTGGSETLATDHRVLAQRRRGRSRHVDRARRRSTTWSARRASGLRPASGLPGENPGIVPPPSQWSGSSLADDVVRPRRLGDADRDGALLLRDRQRRHAAAAAHRARRLRSARQAASIDIRREVVAPRVLRARPRPSCAASCARSCCAAPATRPRRSPATRRPARPARRRWSSTATIEPASTPRRSSAWFRPSIRAIVIYVKIERPIGVVLRRRRRRAGIRADRARGDAARRRLARRTVARNGP